MAKLKIGINGGGIGGLAAAIALRKAGHDVEVYEQASNYSRIGADINLTPNAVRAAKSLGVFEGLSETAARPTHRISRMWDTGEETSRLGMAEEAERKYGAPQLTIHRADLLDALRRQVPAECVLLNHRVSAVDASGDKPIVRFENGASRAVDVLIGADGIHSLTRTALFGPEKPSFTGSSRIARCLTARRSRACRTSTPSPNGGGRCRTCRSSRSR